MSLALMPLSGSMFAESCPTLQQHDLPKPRSKNLDLRQEFQGRHWLWSRTTVRGETLCQRYKDEGPVVLGHPMTSFQKFDDAAGTPHGCYVN